MKEASGHVFKYGDNIDTDVIIPARYLADSDPQHLAMHCLEDLDPTFVKRVQSRRHHRCEQELRLRFLQRACADCD